MNMRLSYLVTSLLAATLSIGCAEKDAEEPATEVAAAPATTAAGEPVPAPSGEALYLEHCASCHDKPRYKAPSRLFISMTGPASVLASMVDGTMVEQASAIDMEGRRAIAEFVTGVSLDSMAEAPLPPPCDEEHAFDPSITPNSAGFGVDLHHSRFQPAETGGLTVQDVPNLEVKWTFAYPNAYKARSQPGYGGGAIYFGSQDGTVWALDAKIGCLRWTFQAAAEVRTGIVVSPWSADDADPQPTLYFGDLLARVYAVDARTGDLRWKVRVEDHRDATITGTPALDGDRLYVPVSSLEVVSAANPEYACCTFRGSVVALDIADGRQLWKNHSISETPMAVAKNRAGADILAPSGAPFWNSPAIDQKRGRLYIGSGENYSSPADANSDAIIAYDLQSGEKLWVSQQTEGDAWNTACLSEFTSDDANCPAENGPDYDFGASPILLTLPSGRDVVIGGQKSGAVMAIDPDSGETLWKTQVGRGGVQGGVHFGMAVEGNRVFAPINDMFYPEDITRYKFKEPTRPGLYALDAATGDDIWSAPAPDLCEGMEHCDPGISAPVTAIPGAIIAGHMDGRLRIYSSEDGEVLWELNTLQDFPSVSGATARGGSFSGSGPVVADGMIYVNSGYGIYNHMPGNLLLAIGVAD
jgi:polyvinyl alcohol dehydrogenase (cytochrome)